MEVTVVLYGQLVDIMGSASLKINDVQDTDTLIQKLQLMQPALENLPYAVAVNRKVIQKNSRLENNSEVVLLPPFAGG